MTKCLECGKEYKRLNIFHLQKHGLTEKTYLKKYPDAKLYHDGYRDLVSQKTKEGMRKPEVWEKFKKGIQNRDISGENNPFYGKIHSEETKKKISENEERAEKISKGRKEWWNGKRGKTVEELYGEEIGTKLRKELSERNSGEGNPAYGKVYERTGSCKLGKYKGQLFRGILEYSFLKYLEKNDIHFSYEPFVIKYKFKNVNRTYHPDYLLKNFNRLVEVKASFHLSKKYFNEEVQAKKQAAEEYCKQHGLTYEILTEKDFPILTYAQAYTDPHVEWIRK